MSESVKYVKFKGKIYLEPFTFQEFVLINFLVYVINLKYKNMEYKNTGDVQNDKYIQNGSQTLLQTVDFYEDTSTAQT